MNFEISSGTTFLWPCFPNFTAHLWIILTDPKGNPSEIVMVNITTKRSHSDSTVELSSGDHPFINRQSVVYFNFAQFKKVDIIKKDLDSGKAKLHAPFNKSILKKNSRGSIKVPSYTPIKVKKYCQTSFSNKS